ncbi:MAG: PqiC family protein [Desulfosalsimonadaceae bacterium]|nr:PqiC family protein [Desulfosalsimonadaceae bacterium]
MRFQRLSKEFGFLAILIFLAAPGCRSAATPVTFYTLSAVQEAADKNPEISALRDKVITIGPARFPNFLDRPQIVTRSGVNRLHISEFHRWAGNLDQDFLSILAENLSIRLASPQVLIYSWKDQVPPDYRVELEVHQFEGQMGEAVLLNVTWAVRGREGDAEPLILRRSVIRREISGNDYDALVAAHSQALGELSGEIAAAIMGLAK